MEYELKPCPFCGGEPIFEDVTYGFKVKCYDCGADITLTMRTQMEPL